MSGLVNVSRILRSPRFVQEVIRRRPKTTIDDFGVASTAYDEQPIQASVQPLTPAQAKLLPEGTRLDNVLAFFSIDEMSPGNGKDKEPDVMVTHDGNAYKVIQSEPWGDNGYFVVFAEGFVK